MTITSIAEEQEDLGVWEELAPAIADYINLSSRGGGKGLEINGKWDKIKYIFSKN